MKRTLGQRLAQARREKGVREWRDVSRGEIAKAAKVDPSMISNYESDKNVPGEDVLLLLSKFLGRDPAWLRYGVDTTSSEIDGPRTAAEALAMAKKPQVIETARKSRKDKNAS